MATRDAMRGGAAAFMIGVMALLASLGQASAEDAGRADPDLRGSTVSLRPPAPTDTGSPLAPAHPTKRACEEAYTPAPSAQESAGCHAARSVLLSSPLQAWTNVNDGADSGLDADLLDGLTSGYFLSAIVNETLARRAEDDVLRASLATEGLARVAMGNALRAELELESAERRGLERALRQAVREEAEARDADLATLRARLGEEADVRAAADLVLRDDLAMERAARAAADLEEAVARRSADGALAADLDDERTARLAGSATLSLRSTVLEDRATRLESYVNGGAFTGSSAVLTGGGTFGGNVGIGTTPRARLHIAGTSPEIRLQATGVAEDPKVSFLDHDGERLGWLYAPTHTGSIRLSDGGGDALVLQRGHSVNVWERAFRVGTDGLARVHFVVQQGSGNVGVGTASPGAKLEVAGGDAIFRGSVRVGTPTFGSTLTVAGDVEASGAIRANADLAVGDVAEPVVGDGLAAGDVVVADGLDASGKLRVKLSDSPRSRAVVGVVSTSPSLRLAGLATDVPLAITGVVPVKVVGSVAVGDLLATSATRGHAEACRDGPECSGAVIAKAVEAHAGEGAGRVHALVGWA